MSITFQMAQTEYTMDAAGMVTSHKERPDRVVIRGEDVFSLLILADHAKTALAEWLSQTDPDNEPFLRDALGLAESLVATLQGATAQELRTKAEADADETSVGASGGVSVSGTVPVTFREDDGDDWGPDAS